MTVVYIRGVLFRHIPLHFCLRHQGSPYNPTHLIINDKLWRGLRLTAQVVWYCTAVGKGGPEYHCPVLHISFNCIGCYRPCRLRGAEYHDGFRAERKYSKTVVVCFTTYLSTNVCRDDCLSPGGDWKAALSKKGSKYPTNLKLLQILMYLCLNISLLLLKLYLA